MSATTRDVDALTVFCPSCFAHVGQACEPRSRKTHRARRRKAAAEHGRAGTTPSLALVDESTPVEQPVHDNASYWFTGRDDEPDYSHSWP